MNQGSASAAPRAAGFPWIPAVFVSSFAIMAVELALTRLFSVVLWYHFVFIAVSMTIFGLALGGLLIDRLAGLRILGTLLLAWGGGGIILMMAAIGVLPLAAIWPVYLLFSIPPFVFLGAFQALAFSRHDRPGYLYFADLLGAALSGAGTIVALRLIPLPAFIAGVAFLLIAAGVVLALSREPSHNRRVLVTGGILLVALAGSSAVGLWEMNPNSQAAMAKQMYQVMANTGGRVLWTRWNEMSRVDVVDLGDRRARYIFTDGGAVSFMYRFDGDLRSVGDLRRDNGYFPLANGVRDRVAIIGAGGGKDVLISLLAGAKKITAIEINRGVVEAMQRFRSYNGALYDRPDVQLVTGDGRRYLENTKQRFDVIYLPLVMTQAAGSIGQGLVENYTSLPRSISRTIWRNSCPAWPRARSPRRRPLPARRST